MDPLQNLSLTSVTGIIAATFFVIEILKRIFTKNVWFGKIPTFVYAIVIAAVLSLIAHLLKDANGNPYLVGNIYQVMWRSVISAASASGFYTWLGATSIADATPLLPNNQGTLK